MECKRLHAIISVEQCLARQKSEEKTTSAICKNCEQGKLARQGLLNDDDVKELKEEVVNGNNTVIINEDEEKGKTKVCSKCGKEKPLSEFCRDRKTRDGRKYQCKECDAERERNRYLKKKKDRELIIQLDFSKHPEVLEGIKKIADEELRTPENQILYWLINIDADAMQMQCRPDSISVKVGGTD